MCQTLDDNPRVQWCRTQNIYNHPEAAFSLGDIPHKCSNVSAVWMEEILHNNRFYCPVLHERAKFIYLIREPAQSLAQIVATGIRPDAACRYYTYRLRRICQMARRTPNAVMLTLDDLINRKGLPLLEKLLNLKNKLEMKDEWLPKNMDVSRIPAELVSEGERSYESHLYHMRELFQRYGRPLAVPRREDDAASDKITPSETLVAN